MTQLKNNAITIVCDRAFEEEELESIKLIINEYLSATTKYGPFNSAHEGYAIIEEEFDELWDEIKKKNNTRDVDKMKREASQVGAMAMRFIVDVMLRNKGFI